MSSSAKPSKINLTEVLAGEIDRFIDEEITYARLRGIDDSKVDKLYSLGMKLLELERFDVADGIFQILTTFCHNKGRHWFGYALCRKFKKDYIGSMKLFLCSAILDKDNPHPWYEIACCQVTLHQYNEAQKTIAKAIDIMAKNERVSETMKQRMHALQSVIKRRLAAAETNSETSTASRLDTQ